jgi:hypothetical protein
MKAIGFLSTSRTYNGRELYIDVYEYKTVYHVFARWDGECEYIIKGHKVTKRIKTKQEAADVVLNNEWTKNKLGI